MMIDSDERQELIGAWPPSTDRVLFHLMWSTARGGSESRVCLVLVIQAALRS